MRGADLEPSHVLLEHLARRLATHVRELGAVADEPPSDGLLWALGADLAELGAVVEVLLDRETL